MSDRDIEQAKDRLLNLADEIGLHETLSVLREWRLWEDFLKVVADDVIDDGMAVSNDAYDGMNADYHDALKSQDDFFASSHRLHEAICEGRRQDAIDILNEISDERFRSVREQHNLFPDRVTA